MPKARLGNDRRVICTDTSTPTETSEGEKGEFRFDENYIYICIAPKSWKRIGWTAWGN
jgi:hypothetical protein